MGTLKADVAIFPFLAPKEPGIHLYSWITRASLARSELMTFTMRNKFITLGTPMLQVVNAKKKDKRNITCKKHILSQQKHSN